MAEHFIDKVDMEARKRAAQVIHERFKKVLEDILEGKPPVLEIPKRTLANVRFDPERGILVMGEGKIRRDFLNMGEARKFMQTLLMAAIIYQALVENEYPTIRDLYYRGKHTIVYRDLRGRKREENTWEEQSESDAAIRDVEVYTGLLREDMLILSKEKGKVVGRMIIRSGGDTIDLSKMGHGAYAIESTPDLIEIKDVDAEFVLVVEKDAVFQQLHRIKFWDKYRAILVTGAGQPDRATRRFVRRLNEELGLPIYILTDSITRDEVVLARDPATGAVMAGPIEELLGNLFTPGLERERVEAPLQVPSWNPISNSVEWTRVGYLYRHFIEDEILEIETMDRGTIRVTRGHSLFLVRDGRVQVAPAERVRVGDQLLVAEAIPAPTHSPSWEAAWESTATYTSSSRGGSLLLMDESIPLQTICRSGELVDLPGDAFNLASRLGRPLIEGLIGECGRVSRDGELIIHVAGEEAGKKLSLLLLMTGYSPRIIDGGVTAAPNQSKPWKPGVGVSRIVSVRRRWYEGYVYDLAVPLSNSFTGGHGVILHNSDPYGWYIYSVFKVGSIQLSYESERLATPKARFLGVSMSDVFGYRGKKPYLSERERKNYIIKAKDVDIKRAKELMRYSWFRSKGWRRELKLFLEKKAKLEIEAMASKGLRFLADTYIPEKIQTGDWIE